MTNPRQDKAWLYFAAWCRGRGLCPLPAHPWTVAAYLRWCQSKMMQREIPSTLRAIAAAHGRGHMRRPERSALVRRTLKIVALQSRKRPSRGSAASLADVLASPGTPPPKRKPKVTTPATKARTLRATPKLVSRRRLGR